MRWRCGWAAACSALVVAGAGCGGAAQRSTPPAPHVARTVASPLAARADAVAAALGRGDACTARGETYALTRAAQNARMPARLRAPLLKAVRRLAGELPACEPPPPPPPPPASEKHGGKPKPEHGRGHEKHKKHGHGKHGEGD